MLNSRATSAWDQPLSTCWKIVAFCTIVIVLYLLHFVGAFFDVDREDSVGAIFTAQRRKMTKIALQNTRTEDRRRMAEDGHVSYVLDDAGAGINQNNQTHYSLNPASLPRRRWYPG